MLHMRYNKLCLNSIVITFNPIVILFSMKYHIDSKQYYPLEIKELMQVKDKHTLYEQFINSY